MNALGRRFAALATLVVVCASPFIAQGQPAAPAPAPVINQASGANLNISPKRVTLDRSHRTATVFVFNQGTDTATFDISLVDRAMMPNGQILAVSDAGASADTQAVAERVKSALDVLQVSPRRITLSPGQGQTIRLRLARVPDSSGAGELRSHLTISSLPPRDAGTTAEAASASNTAGAELRFQINALFGLSVPAIVRLADPDVRAGIENPRISFEHVGGPDSPVAPVLSLDLVRQGASSLYGNLEIKSAGQPKEPSLGVARGVGVYPEIDRRSIQIVLSRAPAPGEHVEVSFTDDDTSPGKLLAKLVL